MIKRKAVLGLGVIAFVVVPSGSLFASVGSERYVYDSSGNVVQKTIGGKVTDFVYGAGNQLQASGDLVYEYDSAGRLVAVADESGKIVKEYAYGYLDKVVGVSEGEKTSQLYYNAEGHLVGIERPEGTESFVWDGNALAARGDRAFSNESHMMGGAPVLASAGEVVVSDYLGTTLASSDQQYSGTAFGEGLEGRALYTARPHVAELGGHLFQYRVLSSDSCRWITSDPSGFPDGANSYAYVLGDPLSKTDPLGLAWTETEWAWDEEPGGFDNEEETPKKPSYHPVPRAGNKAHVKFQKKIYVSNETIEKHMTGWNGKLNWRFVVSTSKAKTLTFKSKVVQYAGSSSATTGSTIILEREKKTNRKWRGHALIGRFDIEVWKQEFVYDRTDKTWSKSGEPFFVKKKIDGQPFPDDHSQAVDYKDRRES